MANSDARTLLSMLSALALISLASGCNSEKKKAEPGPDETSATGDKTGSADGDKTGTADGDKTGTADGDEPAAATKRPKVELLATAVERRLHPDRVESSTFLWNDWNRFQENYHPLYLIDDDPKTAWVEGAKGSGENEWVRMHVTEVAEATKIRLRIRNGYHKSPSLFKKNARAKTVTITLLPSEKSSVLELADNMEWQTVELEQPAGELESIEIRVDSVYPGSKYADLCLSDVEVFVTSRTPENPEFEKRKYEQVLAWKQERLDAAKLFASKAATEMPIAAGYRVTGAKTVKGASADMRDRMRSASRLLGHASSAAVAESALLDAAKSAFDSKFADWVPVEISVKGGRALPAVDGLYRPASYELAEASPPHEDGYAIPGPGKLEFLISSRLATFESTTKTTVKRALSAKDRVCQREDKRHFYYFRPKAEMGKSDGVLRRLLIVECGQVEERDGYYAYAGLQLLEFDATGRLALLVAPSSVTGFEWSPETKLVGGKRVRSDWNAKVFVDGLVVARAN